MSFEEGNRQGVIMCNPRVSRDNEGQIYLSNPELAAFRTALDLVISEAERTGVLPDMFISVDHPFKKKKAPVVVRDMIRPETYAHDKHQRWFTLTDLLPTISQTYEELMAERDVDPSLTHVLPEQSLHALAAAIIRRHNFNHFNTRSERRIFFDQDGVITPGCISIAAGAFHIAVKRDIADGRLKSRGPEDFRHVTSVWQYDPPRTSDAFIDLVHRFLTEDEGLGIDPELISHLRVSNTK